MKKLLLAVFALIGFISFSFGQGGTTPPQTPKTTVTAGNTGQGTPIHVTRSKFTPPPHSTSPGQSIQVPRPNLNHGYKKTIRIPVTKPRPQDHN